MNSAVTVPFIRKRSVVSRTAAQIFQRVCVFFIFPSPPRLPSSGRCSCGGQYRCTLQQFASPQAAFYRSLIGRGVQDTASSVPCFLLLDQHVLPQPPRPETSVVVYRLRAKYVFRLCVYSISNEAIATAPILLGHDLASGSVSSFPRVLSAAWACVMLDNVVA